MESNADKVRSTLRQFVRDWSLEVNFRYLMTSNNPKWTSSDLVNYLGQAGTRCDIRSHTGRTRDAFSVCSNCGEVGGLGLPYSFFAGKRVNYPKIIVNRGKINVLVPGAGLGRLAFEVVSRGRSQTPFLVLIWTLLSARSITIILGFSCEG